MKWNCYVVLLFRKKKEFAIESHTKRNNSVYILLDRNQSPFLDGHQFSCQIQFFLLVRLRIRFTPNHKLSKSQKLKRTNYPETQASESLPILAPESELVSPAGPLLDRLEALQRRHRVPKQQREEFRQEFRRHPETSVGFARRRAKAVWEEDYIDFLPSWAPKTMA